MNKIQLSFALAGLVAAATPAPVWPQSLHDPDREKIEVDQEQPFYGKVASVDLTQKTLTVEAKLIHITADTRLTKEGEAIKLSDVRVGDEVDGMARLACNGHSEATTVKVIPKQRGRKLQATRRR
jgi:hypothetical protein